uniref:Uncharacterized protein n=1 Tax=Peronospora matthiolae TaxID=2874970 RepID=A0AAV1V825_9STRA
MSSPLATFPSPKKVVPPRLSLSSKEALQPTHSSPGKNFHQLQPSSLPKDPSQELPSPTIMGASYPKTIPKVDGRVTTLQDTVDQAVKENRYGTEEQVAEHIRYVLVDRLNVVNAMIALELARTDALVGKWAERIEQAQFRWLRSMDHHELESKWLGPYHLPSITARDSESVKAVLKRLLQYHTSPTYPLVKKVRQPLPSPPIIRDVGPLKTSVKTDTKVATLHDIVHRKSSTKVYGNDEQIAEEIRYTLVEKLSPYDAAMALNLARNDEEVGIWVERAELAQFSWFFPMSPDRLKQKLLKLRKSSPGSADDKDGVEAVVQRYTPFYNENHNAS